MGDGQGLHPGELSEQGCCVHTGDDRPLAAGQFVVEVLDHACTLHQAKGRTWGVLQRVEGVSAGVQAAAAQEHTAFVDQWHVVLGDGPAVAQLVCDEVPRADGFVHLLLRVVDWVSVRTR